MVISKHQIFIYLFNKQDEMSMHLVVQEVPEQPKSVNINSKQSRSIQLTWYVYK